MTRDRSQLTNFVNKFLGTVKFGNDHVSKIMGYSDCKIGNVTISRVYFVEGLGQNLFSVRHFCDSDLEVAFRQHTCFIRNLNFGAINHLARQGLVRGLPKLKFKKDHLCSACAMGKSKKKSYKPKSKDTNQEKLYLLHMDLCGPIRVESVNGKKGCGYRMLHPESIHCTSSSRQDTIENLGKLQPKADFGIFIGDALTKAFRIYNRRTRRIFKTINVHFHKLTAMASEQTSSGLALYEMTPATISSGLLFDEILDPSPSVDPSAPEVIAPLDEVIPPEHAESTGSPSSTTVDQDAPSLSKSQTTPETQPHVIPNDVKEGNYDIEVAHMGNNPLFGMPILEVASDQSSSTVSSHIDVHRDHQIPQHNRIGLRIVYLTI
nr:ribonuclease H-like domain-containing protein [Tanacetum cinerariifolium]